MFDPFMALLRLQWPLRFRIARLCVTGNVFWCGKQTEGQRENDDKMLKPLAGFR